MTTSRRARPRGGAPLWAHLVGIVVVPVLGIVVAASWLVRDAETEAASARGASRAAVALGELEIAHAALQREVVPLLAIDALDDLTTVRTLRATPAESSAVRSQSDRELLQARRESDRALARVPTGAAWSSAAQAARRRLRTLREAVSTGGLEGPQIFDAYDGVGRQLQRAQALTSAGTDHAALEPATVQSLEDVELVADLAQGASRTVPLYLSSLPELTSLTTLPWATQSAAQRAALRRRWTSAWQDYATDRSLAAHVHDARLRRAWRLTLAEPVVSSLDTVLAYAAADSHGAAASASSARAVDELSASDLTSLLEASERRDAAFTALVHDAVDADRHRASAAAERAERRTLVSAAGALLLVLSAGAAAGVLGRRLSRSLGTLAAGAEQISRGQLHALEARGPREVRAVSSALASAIANLRRVREQVAAVAAGDLTNSVLDEAAPGPLGGVVHESVRLMVRSVRAREELQDELAHQASHDALTGLANRAQALRLLEAALHRAQRSGGATGLLFIDLDGFKVVNDTHGHAAGDAVLRCTAARLTTALRGGDSACRLGGDEFIVIIESVGAEQDLVELAERLVRDLGEPIVVESGSGPVPVGVGASIGIAVALDGQTSADALVAEADSAVYRAKAAGRGRAEVFGGAGR